MADYHFTIDTKPMASELKTVSHNVETVSGAVVAMQAAVIAAEKEGADHVCENVNRGFYSLMHSQISQKIAQLTSTVEVKLMSLAQYAAALRNIQSRMQNDYNMISARYAKLFKSINNNLEARVAELDMPVFKLVDRDIKIADSRMRLNAAQFAVNQAESILSSQMIANARIKTDTDNALAVISNYVIDAAVQSQKTEDSMYEVRIDSIEDIYLPVSVVESASGASQTSVNYYVARSGRREIDDTIDVSVREQSVNSVLNGLWIDIDPRDKAMVEKEFLSLMASCEEDERVKKEIEKMFANTGGIKKLSHEL